MDKEKVKSWLRVFGPVIIGASMGIVPALIPFPYGEAVGMWFMYSACAASAVMVGASVLGMRKWRALGRDLDGISATAQRMVDNDASYRAWRVRILGAMEELHTAYLRDGQPLYAQALDPLIADLRADVSLAQGDVN